MIRLPDGMRDGLKEAAERNGRSMNAEIVARLEAYDMIQWRMSELMEEKEKLTAQLEEQRSVSAQLQRLLSENFEDAKTREDNDREASEAIEKRFNELKQQTDYLENLKTELLVLSKERDGLKSEAEDMVRQQSEAIKMLVESNRTATTVLRDLANRSDPEMTGTPLTPELFDKLFNQLVKVEEKLGKSEK
ncbi:hypothetical protein N182_28760 [Sinorhizobium sp. GL2]|nr:hypothetical protein N182_28760 [Sinorhizobium sp. GL2]